VCGSEVLHAIGLYTGWVSVDFLLSDLPVSTGFGAE
jgi:hypothetical protein